VIDLGIVIKPKSFRYAAKIKEYSNALFYERSK
jgi:hypothetical protein